MVVFVDINVVVIQNKHTGQQGYQWTRQTDAGVLRHVVSLIEWAQAIWKDFEGIMRIQMAPDFYQCAQPTIYQFVPFFFYFAFLLFHFHCYWFSVFIPSLVLLFSCTDRLINLKVFIAVCDKGRNHSYSFKVVGFFFPMQLLPIWIIIIITAIKYIAFTFYIFKWAVSTVVNSSVSENELKKSSCSLCFCV